MYVVSLHHNKSVDTVASSLNKITPSLLAVLTHVPAIDYKMVILRIPTVSIWVLVDDPSSAVDQTPTGTQIKN